jgi:CO/xanthine dehydrogenase Mo-binding subunit
MVSYRVIGQPSPRADGPEKVTGSARYTADVALPGTLWGKVLRSPLAHARVVSIDTSMAKEVEGVYAVLTGADVKGVLYGRRLRDIPVLANEQVRYIGEPIAAVAAVDEDIAQQALDLIEVEYQELPAVLDPLEAMKEDAHLVHPDVNSYVGLPKPLEKPSNIFVRDYWGRGDVEAGFAQAELIVENEFRTPAAHQAYLEPHSCLVWIDEDDRVQVWCSNKGPYALRQQLSDALGIPLERFLINHTYIGGDFGGKGSPLNVALCYFLALRSGRPVKMVMDYVEEFMAANPRHPSIVRLKTGVKRDGTLVAHQAQVIFNSGAHGGFKPRVNLGGPSRAGGCYKIPNVHIEGLQVYTNNVPCGHMRSPGEPQALFALESHMDMIARRLGLGPLEFRMRNLIEESDETPAGTLYEDVRAKETLAAAVEAAQYHSPKPANVGRGIAMGERGPGGGESHAAVTLNPDGTVVLNTPIFEQGDGDLHQLAADGH